MKRIFMNQKLNDWVKEMAELCKPDDVYFCNGGKVEYDFMINKLLVAGMAIRLNPKKRPNSYLFRSHPSDVARLEKATIISSENKDDAGPTNIWIAPDELKRKMRALYDGCMKGRTMFVIPFSMGPVGSPLSELGVEITDSPYVVANMHIMTRVISDIPADKDFIPCMHSVGVGGGNAMWPCAPIEDKYISHFPEEKLIWSYGSGYGGNALLGKKCLALRIASYMAFQQGWMAEHMLILRLTNPQGRRYHIAGAFPSACGKTNLAMMNPSLPGWKVECIGDDIAWIRRGPDGKLYAINPENGFFGVAPGTSYATNPNAMETIKENTIFTNCALTGDGDVWWEGIDGEIPLSLTDWQGNPWKPGNNGEAAHANARFTAPAAQCPVICKDWENPTGVPIDAFLFGGRRESAVPLVFQARDWNHGVFLGSILASEKTAADLDKKIGELRYDPMAMLPFCGYNMGDYFGHWLKIGDILKGDAPPIFYVNWFRKDAAGKFMWPGYGHNSRALKWICDRIDGHVSAEETAIGLLPKIEDLDLSGVNVSGETMRELLRPHRALRRHEIPLIAQHYKKFGSRLPERLARQFIEFVAALG